MYLSTTYYYVYILQGGRLETIVKRLALPSFRAEGSQCRDLNVTIFAVQIFGGDKFYSAEI
jgi:hypothetical protein